MDAVGPEVVLRSVVPGLRHESWRARAELLNLHIMVRVVRVGWICFVDAAHVSVGRDFRVLAVLMQFLSCSEKVGAAQASADVMPSKTHRRWWCETWIRPNCRLDCPPLNPKPWFLWGAVCLYLFPYLLPYLDMLSESGSDSTALLYIATSSID